MCLFTLPVDIVSSTNIFARIEGEGGHARQLLVYAMRMAAREDVAMVLPLPVVAGAREDAVRFVDLSQYLEFFGALREAFPRPVPESPSRVALGAARDARPTLAVHRVGAFEASFVPSRGDFSRLDPRFVLPDTVLDALPTYEDWGFAVFKLRGDGAVDEPRPGLWRRLRRRLRGEAAATIEPMEVHPMAFSFPTRWPDRLFFPTVHVHDGELPSRARFDHDLFFQVDGDRGDDAAGQGPYELLELPRAELSTPTVETSACPLERTMDIGAARGLIDGQAHARRMRLEGLRENRDVVVALRRAPGDAAPAP